MYLWPHQRNAKVWTSVSPLNSYVETNSHNSEGVMPLQVIMSWMGIVLLWTRVVAIRGCKKDPQQCFPTWHRCLDLGLHLQNCEECIVVVYRSPGLWWSVERLERTKGWRERGVHSHDFSNWESAAKAEYRAVSVLPLKWSSCLGRVSTVKKKNVQVRIKDLEGKCN